MPLSILDVKDVLKAGAGLTIPASGYSVTSLKDFARIAGENRVYLHIIDTGLSTSELKLIAAAGNGFVHFEMT